MQFPAAYRSLSRLSSAPSAKAFALRPSSLDHQFAIFRLLLLSLFYSNCQQDFYSLPVETVVSSSTKFYFISFRSYYSVLKVHLGSLRCVVGQNGLEPSTSRLSVVCSSQLSYWPVSELLAILRYRADISVSGPHSKRFGSRPCLVVESTGIEPVTSCLQGRRSPS